MSARSDLPDLLQRLLSLPTAPFHEHFVSSFLCDELESAGLDFQLDSHGNILAGDGGEENSVACVAHMDHPGFEIVGVRGDRVEAEWFGGVGTNYFVKARMVIYDQVTGAVRARGVVEKIWQGAQGRVEKLALRVKGGATEGDFGTWDLVPFRRRGKLIHTKGADDLVGCAVILAALKELKERGIRHGVRAVFTRAEEQGFIGTLGMVYGGLLPASARIISIETSKALPGVVLGGGPVIRLGDRTSMFHHQMVIFMDHVARELQKRDRRFLYQRRVMDGGTCEATPYQLEGHVTGGVAVPLRNYHNQGKRRVAPEGVHLDDVQGAVRFLVELVLRIGEFEAPTEAILKRFRSAWQKYGDRLRTQTKG